MICHADRADDFCRLLPTCDCWILVVSRHPLTFSPSSEGNRSRTRLTHLFPGYFSASLHPTMGQYSRTWSTLVVYCCCPRPHAFNGRTAHKDGICRGSNSQSFVPTGRRNIVPLKSLGRGGCTHVHGNILRFEVRVGSTVGSVLGGTCGFPP